MWKELNILAVSFKPYNKKNEISTFLTMLNHVEIGNISLTFDTGATRTTIHSDEILFVENTKQEFELFFESKNIFQKTFHTAGGSYIKGYLCKLSNCEIGSSKYSNMARKQDLAKDINPIIIENFYFYLTYYKKSKDYPKISSGLLGMDILENCYFYDKLSHEDLYFSWGKGGKASYDILYKTIDDNKIYDLSLEKLNREFEDWKKESDKAKNIAAAFREEYKHRSNHK